MDCQISDGENGKFGLPVGPNGLSVSRQHASFDCGGESQTYASLVFCGGGEPSSQEWQPWLRSFFAAEQSIFISGALPGLETRMIGFIVGKPLE